MRKISIIGNVTKDAEVRNFENSRSAVNFDVAVNERYKDKQGQKVENTHFIRCVMWRDNTEIAKYILKGTKIYVEGKPEAEAYVNREGKAVAVQKIRVDEVEFLGSPNRAPGQQQSASVPAGQGNGGGGHDDAFLTPTPDDDLPF
jgi:single-strand DNA-binding protein